MNFTESLLKCINIYDIMCLCYKKIKDDYENILTNIIKYNPRNFVNIASLIDSYIDEGATLFALRNLINSLKKMFMCKKFEFGDYYAIIKCIDNKCQFNYNNLQLQLNDCDSYSALNNNYNLGYYIFPILEETFLKQYRQAQINYDKRHKKLQSQHVGLRKRRTNYTYNDINEYLKNYVIIYRNEFNIKIHYLHPGLKFFDNIINESKFSVLTNPLMRDQINDVFIIEENVSNFSIINTYDDKKNRILNTFEYNCINNDSDILIFPELFFTGINSEDIEKIISRSNISKNKLIVVGSMHENKCNKSLVYTSWGTKILEQHKKTPFIYNNKFEDLTNSDNIFNIIDIEKFGRIAIMICKDICNEDLKSIICLLRIDLLIIVSYTKSLDLRTDSEELAKKYHCVSILCNSCSSVENDENIKNIGFITVPSKRKTNRDALTKFYSYNKKEECELCEFCKGFNVNFSYSKIEKDHNDRICMKINIEKC